MTEDQSQIVAMLRDASGETVPLARIVEALGSTPESVRAQICYIRRADRTLPLETVWRRGYRLSARPALSQASAS